MAAQPEVTPAAPVVAGPEPPPDSGVTADELLAEMNRVPLFMTHLDPEDTQDNPELDALRSLAYEGTRAEVAGNFREQGNECAVAKQWSDARQFYTRAVAVLEGKEGDAAATAAADAEIELFAPGGTSTSTSTSSRGDDAGPVVVDLDEEEKKEKLLLEQCLVNRALCNLELKNYRACRQDCARALTLNGRNVKAYYRVASASLALDKLADAADACRRALLLDPSNAAARALSSKIEARAAVLEKQQQERTARLQQKQAEAETLQTALQARTIAVRVTKQAPVDLDDDARLQLQDPLDAKSTLQVPALLLYPTHAQSDLVKAFRETETIADHLAYILPLPWDETAEFAAADQLDCYMDTAVGGLARVGKNIPLSKILAGGKFELTDAMCKIYVVPKAKASDWIAEVKRRKT